MTVQKQTAEVCLLRVCVCVFPSGMIVEFPADCVCPLDAPDFRGQRWTSVEMKHRQILVVMRRESLLYLCSTLNTFPFFFFFSIFIQNCCVSPVTRHTGGMSHSRGWRAGFIFMILAVILLWFFFRIVSLIVSCLLVSLQIDHAVRWLKIFGRRGQDFATDSTVFLLIFLTHN